tara:strand:+ start:383 stop:766 length:384 start_codon:yes stop_codon:yes gene_type:complete
MNKKYLSISELSIALDLVNSFNKKPKNHILRYWEKEFTQIRPKIINGRRYYSKEQVEILKLIKFLLKNEGLTINGVKSILNNKKNKLDDYNSYSLRTDYYKKYLKDKTDNILKKLKELKKYGKKNSR